MRFSDKTDTAVFTLGRAWTGDITRTTTAANQLNAPVSIDAKGPSTDGVTRVTHGHILFPKSAGYFMRLFGENPLTVVAIDDGATIVNGDSGGPVFNSSGEIVGVISGSPLDNSFGNATVISPLSVDPGLLSNSASAPINASPAPAPSLPQTAGIGGGSSVLGIGAIVGLIAVIMSAIGMLNSGGIALPVRIF